MKRRVNIFLVLLVMLSAAACGQPPAQPPAASPTPAPTPTLPSGWKRFENKNISIAMPDTFIGGSLTSADQSQISDAVKKLGGDFEQMAEAIKQNPDLYLLYVMDTSPTPSGVMTNLNVVHEKVLSIIDPAAYMKALEKQLPAQFKIKSKDEITLFGQPAGRMVVELSLAGKDMTEVMYLLKHGEYIYALTYTTGSADLAAKLAMFEQSLQSLTINPE